MSDIPNQNLGCVRVCGDGGLMGRIHHGTGNRLVLRSSNLPDVLNGSGGHGSSWAGGDNDMINEVRMGGKALTEVVAISEKTTAQLSAFIPDRAKECCRSSDVESLYPLTIAHIFDPSSAQARCTVGW